jgi:hypothetical protein
MKAVGVGFLAAERARLTGGPERGERMPAKTKG